MLQIVILNPTHRVPEQISNGMITDFFLKDLKINKKDSVLDQLFHSRFLQLVSWQKLERDFNETWRIKLQAKQSKNKSTFYFSFVTFIFHIGGENCKVVTRFSTPFLRSYFLISNFFFLTSLLKRNFFFSFK